MKIATNQTRAWSIPLKNTVSHRLKSRHKSWVWSRWAFAPSQGRHNKHCLHYPNISKNTRKRFSIHFSTADLVGCECCLRACLKPPTPAFFEDNWRNRRFPHLISITLPRIRSNFFDFSNSFSHSLPVYFHSLVFRACFFTIYIMHISVDIL